MTTSDEPKHGLDFRSKYSSYIAVWLFAIFTATGSAYIIFAKNYHFSQNYVTLFPVLIMLLYGALMLFAGKFRLRDDQAADNLYYMGFIFTLVSLATSLSQFSVTQSSDDIVRNFGIAISSTIVGIILRIVFSGMRLDPADVERQARLELAEAARRVKRELDDTVVEFAAYRRATQQSLDDGFREIKENIEDISDSVVKSLDEITKKSTEPLTELSARSQRSLSEVTETICANLKQINTSSGNQTKKIISKTDELIGAIEAFAHRLSNTETPEKTFNIAMEPAVQALATELSKFGDAARAQSVELNNSMKSTREIVESVLAEMSKIRAESQGDINRLNERIERGLNQIRSESQERHSSDAQVVAVQHGQLGRIESTLRMIVDYLKQIKG